MPAGVSRAKYLCFMSTALLAMFTGSQIVHMYYKPMTDLDEYIEQELKRKQANKNKT